MPHRVQKDDIHEGYFIPESAIVIPNIWRVSCLNNEMSSMLKISEFSRQMLRDPRTYPNPSEFNPERYIGNQPQRDPRSIVFGFGRRTCPGENLADASLFISCAMSLAVFDIAKAVENGVEVTPVFEKTPGTIR